MIFMDTYKEHSIKPLNIISEDAIRLITKLNFLNDKDISSFEFEEYIDNSILYFESRSAMLNKTSRLHYASFTSMKKSIIKELRTCDELHINISMRKPNDLYYKIIDGLVMKDFSNMTFEKIYSDTTPVGKNVTGIYDLDYAGYNTVVKNATCGVVTKTKNIGDLFNLLSTNVNITNRSQLEDYLNSLSFPSNDISTIKIYINRINTELKYIKQLYRDEPDTLKKSVKYTNCVAALTMYRKTVINILLNIYSVKLSILNLKPELNEATEDLIFHNTGMINESIHLSEGDILSVKDDLVHTHDAYKDHLERLNVYLDAMYAFGIKMITNIDKLSIIPYGFFDSMHLKKALSDIEEDIDICNPLLYINKMGSEHSDYVNNIMEFLTNEKATKRVNEFKENEHDMLRTLDKEYNIIKNRINYLKSCNIGTQVSSIYERPFNQLGVYANDLQASLIRELSPIVKVSREINQYVTFGDNTDSNLAIVLRQLDTHFNNDEAKFWKDKIMNLAYFMSTSFSNTECTGVVGDASKCSQWYSNDDLLMAYMLYFKNKVYNL